MSAHMKKHPTNHTDERAQFVWHGVHYSVPLRVIKKYKVADNEDTVSIDDVFGDLISQYGESGVLLKGLRRKEGLSQIEFAKMIGVSQNNLSAMENGRRSIGKEIAKRIAEKFGVDYRILL